MEVLSLFEHNFLNKPDEKIARILEGVYHVDGGADSENLHDNDAWPDLGPENSKKEKLKVPDKTQEAREQEMSGDGLQQLENMINSPDDLVQLKLQTESQPLLNNSVFDFSKIRYTFERSTIVPLWKEEFFLRAMSMSFSAMDFSCWQCYRNGYRCH